MRYLILGLVFLVGCQVNTVKPIEQIGNLTGSLAKAEVWGDAADDNLELSKKAKDPVTFIQAAQNNLKKQKVEIRAGEKTLTDLSITIGEMAITIAKQVEQLEHFWSKKQVRYSAWISGSILVLLILKFTVLKAVGFTGIWLWIGKRLNNNLPLADLPDLIAWFFKKLWGLFKWIFGIKSNSSVSNSCSNEFTGGSSLGG